MRYKKIIYSLLLAAAISVNFTMAAFADAESLYDNVLEYDELPELIENFNPTMKNVNVSFYSAVSDYRNMEKAARDGAFKMKDWAEDIEDDIKENRVSASQIETVTENLVNYKTNEAVFLALANAYDNIVDGLEKPAGSVDLKQLQNTLVKGAQSLMNSYHQLQAQKEFMEKNCELAKAVYDMTATKAGIGAATDAELLAAKKDMLTADAGLMQIENGITQIRQNLCMMTGWAADASPEIAQIPLPDVSRIEMMNPSEDAVQAANNNTSVNSVRHVSKYADNKAKRSHQRTVNELEQKAAIAIEDLYGAVLEKRAAYESAATALASAEGDKHKADSKYSMEMLGRVEYLQQEMMYLQKKSASKVAELELTQAIENYEWGVQGIATIE